MGHKRGFYMTKKRKDEFNFIYTKIKELNRYIWADEFQLEIYIRDEKWDEAIALQENICKNKKRLYEYGKEGWDISYS